VNSKPALVLIMAFLGGLAASIRMVNYALYYAALSAVVLIADDVPHPTNLSQEGQRVLYTLVGVAIAAGVALLANRMQKRAASKAS
jgi:uncharacterized membrane protein YccC